MKDNLRDLQAGLTLALILTAAFVIPAMGLGVVVWFWRWVL